MGRPGIGRLTSSIGILHLLATLPLIALVAGDILAAGIFGGASDSFPPDASDYPVILAVFSTLTGILLLVAPVDCSPTWPGRTHLCAPRHGSAPPSRHGCARREPAPVSVLELQAMLPSWPAVATLVDLLEQRQGGGAVVVVHQFGERLAQKVLHAPPGEVGEVGRDVREAA